MKTRFLMMVLAALFFVPAFAQAKGFNNSPRMIHSDKPVQIGEVATHTRFAKSIEDLPIMSGLELMETDDVLFISGPERIAQTTLKGRVDVDSVYYFYRATLPQLGWELGNGNSFVRNGERLKMEVSGANPDAITYVRFDLEPIKP